MNHYTVNHTSLSVAARMASLMVAEDWAGLEHKGIVWTRQYDASWEGHITHQGEKHHVATIKGASEEWTA